MLRTDDILSFLKDNKKNYSLNSNWSKLDCLVLMPEMKGLKIVILI